MGTVETSLAFLNYPRGEMNIRWTKGFGLWNWRTRNHIDPAWSHGKGGIPQKTWPGVSTEQTAGLDITPPPSPPPLQGEGVGGGVNPNKVPTGGAVVGPLWGGGRVKKRPLQKKNHWKMGTYGGWWRWGPLKKPAVGFGGFNKRLGGTARHRGGPRMPQECLRLAHRQGATRIRSCMCETKTAHSIYKFRRLNSEFRKEYWYGCPWLEGRPRSPHREREVPPGGAVLETLRTDGHVGVGVFPTIHQAAPGKGLWVHLLECLRGA